MISNILPISRKINDPYQSLLTYDPRKSYAGRSAEVHICDSRSKSGLCLFVPQLISMGTLFHKAQERAVLPHSSKIITDIYTNFTLGNQVIIHSLRKRTPPVRRIRHTEATLEHLMAPFMRAQKYGWGREIAHGFIRCFLHDFQVVWTANREQFYQLLLLNCRVDLRDTDGKTFQAFFYEEAIDRLEETMPDAFLDSILEEQLKRSLMAREGEDTRKWMRGVLLGEGEGGREEQLSTLRMLSCSLLLPQTIFTDRLSLDLKLEVTDLLRFYTQMGDSLSQVLHCNNLISCPLKHFVASVQEKLQRKRISQSDSLIEEQLSLSTTSEETRKIRKTRQTNNNVLLAEVRCFLEGYTQFIWSYLQLHRLGESRFGRIVNSQILYGLILKSVWGFVDWILQRGFEYQEAKLQEYLQFSPVRNEAKLSPAAAEHLQQLVGGLRDETHPQQYLKKVAVLYRQVSRHCSNADELLQVYQQTLIRAGQTGRTRRLHIFRMRNVIDKLLRVDDSSLNGGEISYSWATWCVMVELFRQRIANKYGGIECGWDSHRSLMDRMDHSLLVQTPLLHKCLSL